MEQYALIAIGYNRAGNMQRLLTSLERAYYGSDNVVLIISIDHSGTDAVEKVAEQFVWTHGSKRIITYSERQGLRKHILRCGDYVKEYEAVAVFEDDIIAAAGFYQYMKIAVERYRDNDRIAGISLYNHLWNVHTNTPFEPAYSQYDAYFIQYAQSWGQIWMRKQWLDFAAWYEKHCEEFGPQEDIPQDVSSWPKTSWLKYHIKYCIEQNKYFVYPYKALSTCFSDVGEHCWEQDSHLQVPMLTTLKQDYCLPSLDDADAIRYDAFFERVLCDGQVAGIEWKDICMDLYGFRKGYLGKRYVLTTRKLPYKCIKTFGMELRPQEMNAIYEIPGEDIFLYDLNCEEPQRRKGDNQLRVFRYRFKLYGHTQKLVQCVMEKLRTRLVSKIKRGK